MKKKLVAKFFNLLASVLLVGQTLTPALPLVVNPSYIYAQEEQAAQDQPQDQPQDQTSQDNSSPSSDTSTSGEPELTPEVSSESSIQPQDESNGSQSPSDTSSNDSNSDTQPQSSAASESDQSPDQEDSAQLAIDVVANSTEEPAISDSLTGPESAASAQLSTDLADYAPESTVKIFGSGFELNQTLTVKVTWPDGTVRANGNREGETDEVTTDSSGNLYFDYQLTGGLSGQYEVEVSNSTGLVLSTATFADNGGTPAKPDSVSTEPLSTSSVKIQWKDKSTDEDDFHVESKPEGGTFEEIGTVETTTQGSTGTFYSFTDEELDCDAKYFYRIRAHRHLDDTYSAFSSNSGNDQRTLYWTTDSVFDLTPDTAVEGATDVPILGFTMTSCKSTAKIKDLKVLYTGTDKNDIAQMKLYQESELVEGFDAGTDTLLDSTAPPGGASNEFNLDPDPNVTIGAATTTFYVVVDLTSTVGNTVDAKIESDKIDIDPNNPDGAAENDWPLPPEEGTWDPESYTTIVPFDTTPPESTFYSPGDESFWGPGGIYIYGSSTDVPDTTVAYVKLSASFSGEDDWFKITQIDNTVPDEPFYWEFVWVPDVEGTYDIMAEATDTAGNTEWSPVVEEVTYDITPPTSSLSSPTNNSFWNTAINIEGNHSDNFAQNFVRLFYRTSGVGENPWTEIDTLTAYNFRFDWTPPFEGTFDIKSEATDMAWNVERSPVVEYVTYDVTAPEVSTPSASPDPTNHPPQILADAVDALSNIASAIFSVDDPDFFFALPLEALDDFFDSLAETLFGPEFDNGMLYPGEGPHTLYVGAFDAAGNFGSNSGPFTVDTESPVSSFDSPEEGSFWNEPIAIAGSSNDSSGDTVDFTRLFYRLHDGDGNPWIEIPDSQQDNEDGNPFNWNFSWTPPEENSFDLLAQATDTAGNIEGSAFVSDVTYDITDPTSIIEFPDEGASYTEEEWNEENAEIRGTAEDSPSSGVNGVWVSIQRDLDDKYWNGRGWLIGEEDDEILNNANFNGADDTWEYDFGFIEPEGADEGYTVRSHAVDNAGNFEDTNVVHFFFSILPIISDENTVNVGSAQVTFVWDTDHEATSRVIYDTVSHPDPLVPTLDDPFDKYGYAFTTGESDTDPKVTSHTLVVCCFDQSTTYYYRTVSHGSPEAQSTEKSFTTPATPPQSINPNSQGPGITTPGPAGPGPSAPSTTVAGAVAGAVAGLGQVLGVGTGEEVLGEATAEATPTASPSPSPTVEPEEAEETKAFWQNWWWLILLALLGGGVFWWQFAKRSKEQK